MGFDFGVEKDSCCFKKKNHWLFKIEDISANGVNSLPPSKSSRPNLSFKTMEIVHLNETVVRPVRPDWKPVNLVLYDLSRNENPIFKWITNLYDPESGDWKRPGSSEDPFIVDKATLELYDGCGYVLETWTFENAWPENSDWTDLDMASGEVICVNLSLRYDRAYIES